MQTATVRKPAKKAFFRQVIIPDDHHINIPVPREWFGKRVEVVISPAPEQRGRLAGTSGKKAVRPPFEFGGMSGKIWMADDFDAPLDDLKDYME